MVNDNSRLDSNQTIVYAYNEEAQAHRVIGVNELVPKEYDAIELTYVAAGNGVGEIETVTYYKDAVFVAVLSLSYDSSNRLISVVRA